MGCHQVSGTSQLGNCGNAPSERGERKGQGNPLRLKETCPDADGSGTAGAEIFAG